VGSAGARSRRPCRLLHAHGRSAILELARHIVSLGAMTDYERGITVNVGVVRLDERAGSITALLRSLA